jgi:hypothetical protein
MQMRWGGWHHVPWCRHIGPSEEMQLQQGGHIDIAFLSGPV